MCEANCDSDLGLLEGSKYKLASKRERDDDKNATTGSGQLVYGKEFQTKVFKVQSGIRYTSAVGFTAVRVTGVTIHDPSCCARLNTPSLTGIPHGV